MRLFVALVPPEEVRQALRAVMGGVPQARWQTDAQLHLTLAFIGEVDRHTGHDIASALARIDRPAFRAHLTQFGTFEGSRGEVATLWIGAGPAAPLGELAAAVGRAVASAGVRLVHRRFVPHLTLARFPPSGGPAPAVGRFLERQAPPALRWTVDAFHLMESRLGREGAHYQSLVRFPLRDGLTGSFADRRRP
ncbi:MAG: RNA 2',3'-cyclic phosphodiesterase [Sphingomonadaceae bacterium]|uniref:RNA 2',3'-cyclic phosphodiesterase n=1 Tax=Thermaurantiacus sp. TaxID=2820283 RepID=UPI00298F2EE8|nr:RNA 2',3'-cyclic phosphodiesterase [Thermaurantiacus sp.]MCS6987240.1 RNA 2',3'-cyclic phosphodiesterase [Sphingomonadaceae bacterium]MDW8414460.1 RNA 2',3'-cyclic phosphodiesterase [Thermaurantiacus sp.]